MRRVLPMVCFLAFVAAAVYLLGPWGEGERARGGALPTGRAVDSPLAPAGLPAAAGEDAGPGLHGPAIVADMVEQAERLSDPGATVDDDLRVISDLLRAYRRLLESGPESSENREVVACLRGNNRMQLVFIAGGHGRVDGNGELLDRFGFPYDFEAVGEDLVVSSRGPDGEPGTDDDIHLHE